MTALGKLLRTTAFQLTLVYLVVFALFAAFLVGYFALNTRRLINEQIVGTVDTEVTALTNQYSQAGIRRLVVIVDVRSRRPGSSLYLITTPTGEGLAGNVASLEPGILDHDGWVETAYRRLEEPESAEHNALVRVSRLPGGIRLLVGRDLDERERMFHIVAVAGRWSVALVVVLGVLGGIFVSRRVLNRVEAMTATAQTIMAGDLSGRLSVTGSGDEFDRLAAQPQRHARAYRSADAWAEGGDGQRRPRSQDAADAAAQPLRGGVADRQDRCRLPARARGDHRGVGGLDPHLRCAADDRAGRIRRSPRRHGRVRHRRCRARRRRALRAVGRGQGPDAADRDQRARDRARAIASSSVRRLPTSSTTRSNTRRPRRSMPMASGRASSSKPAPTRTTSC